MWCRASQHGHRTAQPLQPLCARPPDHCVYFSVDGIQLLHGQLNFHQQATLWCWRQHELPLRTVNDALHNGQTQPRAGHARQYKRLRKVVKRQRTILGITLRWVQRHLQAIPASAAAHLKERLHTVVARATRVHKQRPKDKNKLYAMHAPEVECNGKGKARKPYEFGVKTAIVVTHTHGLMVGARTFAGNPYDGHILAAQLEQTNILLEDVCVKPKTAIVDLGFRGKSVEYHNPEIELIHRGKFKQLTQEQRRWLRRRQAVTSKQIMEWIAAGSKGKQVMPCSSGLLHLRQ